MARMIDVTTKVAKTNEILDCAQRLIYTKGYADMSIQDIINELGISKGAFFHYFPSKSALLEAMLERTSEQGMAVVTPIVDDGTIPPVAETGTYLSRRACNGNQVKKPI